MTAETLAAPRPAEISDADFRACMERLWMSVQNGDASDEWAATCMRDHRPDLPPWDRWAIWEQLDNALIRLECLRMPGGCPCHDYPPADVELLEHAADADAENAIAKIRGH
ncbi:MAG TPA: hypothetical protein VE198_21890 [Actinoallomurus sp.]|nr:hypothetical protein [Actinoallomurus sp.]